MKTFLTLLILFVTNLASHAQNEIILTSGERVHFKKIIFYNKTSLDVKLIDKERKVIPISEVFSIFYEPNIFKYSKPFKDNPGGNTYILIPSPILSEGIINLYKEVSYSGTPGYGGSSTTYLYAEKGDRFVTVYVSGLILTGKKKNLEIMKDFVSDDPQSKQFIESIDFKYNEENITGLFEKYNLSKATWPNDTIQTTKTIDVVFFERNSPRILPTLYLSNVAFYQISKNNEIRLTLEKNKVYKVCLDSLMNTCKTITTSSPVNKYYSINKTANAKINIQNSNLIEAKYYIKNLIE